MAIDTSYPGDNVNLTSHIQHYFVLYNDPYLISDIIDNDNASSTSIGTPSIRPVPVLILTACIPLQKERRTTSIRVHHIRLRLEPLGISQGLTI